MATLDPHAPSPAFVTLADLRTLLEAELRSWTCGWSVGSFGAIGEYHQDEGERLIVDDPENLTRATSRGAIRIALKENVEPVAYELLSPRPHRWSQGIALCLPDAEAAAAQREALTELGIDRDAIRPEDRGSILFDVGLAQPQIDFCVRTSDPDLLRVLRSCCGKPTFATEAGMAILSQHPHRVVISHLGRAEVYQKIGGPDTGGVSPPGPHTHVLPKLLSARKTHSANTPIPDGLTPCAFLYPGNPVIGALGEDTPYDDGLFVKFQNYLAAFGPPAYTATKQRVWRAIENREDPANFDEPQTRLERAALRNAIRQLIRRSEASADQALQQSIEAWRAEFDRASESDDE